VTEDQTVFQSHDDRLSDVDGYTIVQRTGRRPRIHLLRPYNQCNTERSKSGRDTVRVEGSRERLALKLSELGYQRGGIGCRVCFRSHAGDDAEDLVTEYADEM
jgi:hypothetical protein